MDKYSFAEAHELVGREKNSYFNTGSSSHVYRRSVGLCEHMDKTSAIVVDVYTTLAKQPKEYDNVLQDFGGGPDKSWWDFSLKPS